MHLCNKPHLPTVRYVNIDCRNSYLVTLPYYVLLRDSKRPQYFPITKYYYYAIKIICIQLLIILIQISWVGNLHGNFVRHNSVVCVDVFCMERRRSIATGIRFSK